MKTTRSDTVHRKKSELLMEKVKTVSHEAKKKKPKNIKNASNMHYTKNDCLETTL